jgi:hypothetical protein
VEKPEVIACKHGDIAEKCNRRSPIERSGYIYYIWVRACLSRSPSSLKKNLLPGSSIDDTDHSAID